MNFRNYRELLAKGKIDGKDGPPTIPYFTVDFYKKILKNEDTAKLAGKIKHWSSLILSEGYTMQAVLSKRKQSLN